MSHRVDRALYGPSWTEIIIGALLSVLVGVVLGFAVLIFKPVLKVAEVPKDAPANQVYFTPSGAMPSNTDSLAKKEKSLVDGETVEFSESDLAAMFTPVGVKELRAGAKPAAPDKFLSFGIPDFRIKNNEMQVAAPLTFSLYGGFTSVTVQAKGGFEKEDGVYTFAPSHILIGSLPLDKIPFAVGILRKLVNSAVAIPPDFAAAWSKLSDLSFQDASLKAVPAPH